MIKNLIVGLFSMMTAPLMYSQVGINTTTPNSKTLLHVSEQLGTQPKTYKGIITTRHTTVERDTNFNLSDLDNGMLIYNTTQGCYNYWRQTVPSYTNNNGVWINMCDLGAITVTPSVTALDCASATFSPTTITQGIAYSGTLSVPYTGGNAQSYPAGTPFTVNGLTFTLQAGTLSNNAGGNLIYNVSGTATASGNMNINISFGGLLCTVTKNVSAPTGTVTGLNCAAAIIVANVNNIIISVPYTNGNGGAYPAESVASTGTTGLTAERPAGNFAVGNGSIGYLINNTASAPSGTYNFTISAGGRTCTIVVNLTRTTLNCAGITHNGTITTGSPVGTGVTTTVPYTGSSGESYPAASVASTGVTGLTASISAGNFALGSGNLVYTISGTPSGSGTANFSITVAGQTCSFSRTVSGTYPPGYVQCEPTPTAIVELTSPTTGRIWMDRNLEATQAATSSTDTNSYGGFFQWGRAGDGHQCRLSDSYTGPVSNSNNSIANAWYGKFIKLDVPEQADNYYDWLVTHNPTLWQGINGTNNPCPSGYRIPTMSEWQAEGITNSTTAYNNLKLPLAGQRQFPVGSTGLPLEYYEVGIAGYYWSTTVGGPEVESLNGSRALSFNNSSVNTLAPWTRSMGQSVRCIKD